MAEPVDLDRWDAIVAGGGLGGLVCAAYLAASGRRVIVVEQHDVAGGCCQVFRRRRAYEFDVGVHYVGDCGPDGLLPAILAGLGLDCRVPVRPMDPAGFDRIRLPGLAVDVPVGWPAYRDRLTEAIPADGPGIARLVEVCAAVAEATRASLLAPDDLAAVAAVRRAPAVLEWANRSLAELFAHCGLSSRGELLLAAQSPNYGSAPAQVSVRTHAGMLDHYLRGAYYPEGGGQAITAALVEALEAYGGELRTRARVERIVVEGGRTTGVVLAGGRRLHAPIVVSNADYRRTVLQLVGPEHFPSAVVARTRAAVMRMPYAVVYLALDRELPDQANANLWWYRYGSLGEVYEALEQLPGGEVPFLFATFTSVKSPHDRTLCPAGHSNLQLMTMCPPGYQRWGVDRGPADGERYRRNPAYQAAKGRLTEATLRTAEEVLGSFRPHIRHLETATPLTQERYTLSTGGTPHGVGQWGRRVATRPDAATTVPGLYLVGQSTQYGSGVGGVMVGGAACAGQILGRRLLSEVYHGAVVGDPGLLPPRPAGWDPLAVSRGAARRNARGLARIDAAQV
jgi:phytoene dehydrogenase-like protein